MMESDAGPVDMTGPNGERDSRTQQPPGERKHWKPSAMCTENDAAKGKG